MVENQIRQELKRTFDKSYLVEAGAGAGKSTLIVERIANQIMEEDTRLAEIVAITFTKNAGNELESRLRVKLLELRAEIDRKDSEYEVKVSRIERGLVDLDFMEIGTIDSFCGTIIKENPFDTGYLSMGFQLLDQSDEDGLIEEIFYKHCKEIKGYSFYNELVKEMKFNKSKDSIYSYYSLFGAYKESCYKTRVPIGGVKKYEDLGYHIEDFNQKEIEFIDAIVSDFIAGNKLLGLDAVGKNFPLIAKGAIQGGLKKLVGKDNSKGDLADQYERIVKKAMEIKSKEGRDELKRFWDDVKIKKKFDNYYIPSIDLNALVEIEEAKLDWINQLLAIVIDDFRKYYVEYKRSNNLVTFEDLLYYTRELLISKPGIRHKYSDKYKVIYVDEFQDTNPLQTEVLFLLMDQKRDNVDWRQSEIKRGSLFLVGDPKQSIYRFRNADIKIYNEVKARFMGDDDELGFLSLQWNFRSHKSICKYINERFKGEDGSEDQTSFYYKNSKNHQTNFLGMEAKGYVNKPIEEGQDSAKEIQGVYKFLVEAEKADVKFKECSTSVSRYIKKMIDEEYVIREFSKGEGKVVFRPVKYSDFLIMTYSTGKMDMFLQELDAKGIPVALSGKKYYYKKDEIANLIDLIGFIAEPYNKLKYVKMLKNVFDIQLDKMTFEPEEIEVGRISYSYLSKLEASVLEKYNLTEVVEKVDELISYKYGIVYPYEIVNLVIQDLIGIYEDSYTELELKNTYTSLINFSERCKQIECSSLYEFCQIIQDKYVAAPVEREANIDEELPARLMNLHKSKGLEGKIVILVYNTTSKVFDKSVSLTDGEEKVLCLKFNKYISKDWEQLKEKERLYKEGELHRLFYVASTRAVNGLIVATTEVEGDKIWDDICDVEDQNVADIEEVLGINRSTDEVDADNMVGRIGMAVDKEGHNIYRDGMLELKENSYYNIIPSHLEKGRVAWELDPEYEDDRRHIKLDNEDVDRIAMGETTESYIMVPHGPVWGTLIHRVFELVVRRWRKGITDYEPAIKQGISEFYVDEFKPAQERGEGLGSLLYYPVFDKMFKESKKEDTYDQLVEVLYEDIDILIIELMLGKVAGTTFDEVVKGSEMVMPEMPFSMKVALDSEDDLEARIVKTVGSTMEKLSEKDSIKVDGKYVYINGIIDLIVKYKGTYYVIDYKTNIARQSRVDFEISIESKYANQLELYQLIVQKMFQVDKGSCEKYLYSTSLSYFLGLGNVATVTMSLLEFRAEQKMVKFSFSEFDQWWAENESFFINSKRNYRFIFTVDDDELGIDRGNSTKLVEAVIQVLYTKAKVINAEKAREVFSHITDKIGKYKMFVNNHNGRVVAYLKDIDLEIDVIGVNYSIQNKMKKLDYLIKYCREEFGDDLVDDVMVEAEYVEQKK